MYLNPQQFQRGVRSAVVLPVVVDIGLQLVPVFFVRKDVLHGVGHFLLCGACDVDVFAVNQRGGQVVGQGGGEDGFAEGHVFTKLPAVAVPVGRGIEYQGGFFGLGEAYMARYAFREAVGEQGGRGVAGRGGEASFKGDLGLQCPAGPDEVGAAQVDALVVAVPFVALPQGGEVEDVVVVRLLRGVFLQLWTLQHPPPTAKVLSLWSAGANHPQ